MILERLLLSRTLLPFPPGLRFQCKPFPTSRRINPGNGHPVVHCCFETVPAVDRPWAINVVLEGWQLLWSLPPLHPCLLPTAEAAWLSLAPLGANELLRSAAWLTNGLVPLALLCPCTAYCVPPCSSLPLACSFLPERLKPSRLVAVEFGLPHVLAGCAGGGLGCFRVPGDFVGPPFPFCSSRLSVLPSHSLRFRECQSVSAPPLLVAGPRCMW